VRARPYGWTASKIGRLIRCRTRAQDTSSTGPQLYTAGRHPGGRRSASAWLVPSLPDRRDRPPERGWTDRRRSAQRALPPPEGGGVLHAGHLHSLRTSLPREVDTDWRLRQSRNPVSRRTPDPLIDVATADFARGVAALEMSPALRSHPAAPEGVAARIQATTGAIFDSRSVAALEQAPGHRIRPALPREGWYQSRRHDRRDSRTRRGLYRSCLQHVRYATLPPEGGAARTRTPTTGVTPALGVAALKLPPVHRSCAAPSRRTARPAF